MQDKIRDFDYNPRGLCSLYFSVIPKRFTAGDVSGEIQGTPHRTIPTKTGINDKEFDGYSPNEDKVIFNLQNQRLNFYVFILET